MEREFNHDRRRLADIAEYFTERARRGGATHTEVEIEESDGIELSCRDGQLESVTHMAPIEVSASLWMGARFVRSSVCDFSRESIDRMLDMVIPMLKYVDEEDDKAPVEERLEPAGSEDYDVFHPFYPDVDEAMRIALEMEEAGLATDSRVVSSVSCDMSYQISHSYFLNSRGREHYSRCSVQSLDAGFMAKEGDVAETGHYYDVSSDFSDCGKAVDIGAEAARRAVAKLDARVVPTGEYPVIYDAECSSGLFRLFFSAISGPNLYYKSSFLLDSLDRRVFPEWLSIRENPHLKGRLSSRDRDGSGVRTTPNLIVDRGEVRMFLYSLYFARKLGVEPTGHTGGITNIDVTHTHRDRAELMKDMGRGVLVTGLQGRSVNMTTGNYSQGVEGFWVEDGEIAHAFNESTAGGVLADMYANIRGSADDARRCQDVRPGSIWIDSMMIGSGAEG